jgi:hypothetical protein
MSLRTVLVLLLLTLPGLSAGAQDVGPPQEPPGRIEGRIFGRRWTKVAPLPYAVVDISTGYQRLTVTADSLGSYAFANLAPGPWRIRVQHVGYEILTAEVRVPSEGTVTLDLEVRWRPIVLPALLVQAYPIEALRSSDPTSPAEMGELSIRALEAGPGMVEGGLAQAVRSLPGNDPADPRDVLLLRGSATDLKLVLLDGAPIYAPFHMAGLVESFDPLALGGAALFLGGAPARFDGGLSYILDLKSRSPRRDRVRGSAAVDLLTARAFLEGPITSSTGFLLGTRAIHDLGTPLLDQGPSPYGFGELLARLEWKGEGDTGAFLTGFWNQEKVNLDLSSLAALTPTQGEGSQGLFNEVPPGEAAIWGNKALVAGLTGALDQTTAEIRVAGSRYQAELPMGDTIPLFAQGRTDRVRVTADFSRPWGDGSLRFGASMDRHVSDYSAMALDSTQTAVSTEVGMEGTTGGVYLEGSRPLTADLSLRGGIRLDRFTGDSGVRAAPRATLTWMLTENAALTIAAGVYHQFSSLEVGEVQRNLEPGASDSFGGAEAPLQFSVGSANHLVVSLDQILTPGLRLGLEGFVKDFSGVPGVNGQALKASGVDLRVARQGDRAAGWLGYTLTWLWASDGFLTSGNSPFSGRHLLSAGLTTKLSDRAGLRLRASYGDGLPYTSVSLLSDEVSIESPIGPRNTLESGDKVLNQAPELTVGPDEGFLRVEAEVYGIWSSRIGGRPLQLRPYIRVLNALNRRDALFYHWDPYRNEGPQPLADLPIIPLLGFEILF